MQPRSCFPTLYFNHEKFAIFLWSTFHNRVQNALRDLFKCKLSSISTPHCRFHRLFSIRNIARMAIELLTPGLIDVTTKPSLESASAHCIVNAFRAVLETLYTGSGNLLKASAKVKDPIVLPLSISPVSWLYLGTRTFGYYTFIIFLCCPFRSKGRNLVVTVWVPPTLTLNYSLRSVLPRS